MFWNTLMCRNLKIIKRFSTLHNAAKRAMGNQNNIVWIDLEMTGLNPNKDRILEIACIVTNGKLDIVAEGPEIIIHEEENLLNSMNEWCQIQHTKSGLIEASLKSTIDLKTAEMKILNFLMKYTTAKSSPLAGNTIYMDRAFLSNYMPDLNEYLHYRIIDVSSIKELCKRWSPMVYNNAPAKKLTHRSLLDIKESIEELKYFKEKFFVCDLNNTLI